jgi:acyl-CoA reductase-like NAD-dependent aldehyde dehydrogenase
VLVIGPPIEVSDEIGRTAVERKQADLQQALQRARETAESWFSLSPAERERQREIWNA